MKTILSKVHLYTYRTLDIFIWGFVLIPLFFEITMIMYTGRFELSSLQAYIHFSMNFIVNNLGANLISSNLHWSYWNPNLLAETSKIAGVLATTGLGFILFWINNKLINPEGYEYYHDLVKLNSGDPEKCAVPKEGIFTVEVDENYRSYQKSRQSQSHAESKFQRQQAELKTNTAKTDKQDPSTQRLAQVIQVALDDFSRYVLAKKKASEISQATANKDKATEKNKERRAQA